MTYLYIKEKPSIFIISIFWADSFYTPQTKQTKSKTEKTKTASDKEEHREEKEDKEDDLVTIVDPSHPLL
jgi:hypothetical protein